MNLKKFFLLGAVAMALTATFAFKAKPEYVVCSVKDPIITNHCHRLFITSDGCSQYNTGVQCTAYYSATYPAVPAYWNTDGGTFPGNCVLPLNYEEW